MGQSRDLEALLRRCTVRVEQGQGHGTGFFVAPGRVVTCAHVVETTDAQTAPVTIYWQGQTYRAHIEKIFASPYPDLALLRTELQEHLVCICILLSRWTTRCTASAIPIIPLRVTR